MELVRELQEERGRTEDCTRPTHCINLTLATRGPSTEDIHTFALLIQLTSTHETSLPIYAEAKDCL